MAQSIGNLFSATLGQTELESDNEHTLITTGSGETKVIKEVYLDNSNNVPLSSGAGTYLELNGHKVKDVDGKGLTGELIVPPNSTLKLKNHSYPVIFQYQRTWFMGDGNGRLYLKRTINNTLTGEELATISEMKSNSNSVTDYNNIIEVQTRYTTFAMSTAAVNHLWYNGHDNNSVQTLYSIGIDTKNTVGSQQHLYENYKAFGFTPDRWINSSNMWDSLWMKIDNGYHYTRSITGNSAASNGVIGTQQQQTASSFGTTAGYIQQNPTSSYPRGLYVIRDSDTTTGTGMWMFWIPSNGYSTDIYAYTLDLKQNFRFTMPNSWVGSGYADFCVSIDVSNDRLIFWRYVSANQVLRHECKVPWSSITYNSQPISRTSPLHYQATDFEAESITLPSNVCVQSMASCQFSNRMDGGFAYKATDGYLYHLDGDGKHLFTVDSFLSDADGALATANNPAPWAFRSQVAPSFLLSTYGVTQPTFTLSLNGYSIS